MTLNAPGGTIDVSSSPTNLVSVTTSTTTSATVTLTATAPASLTVGSLLLGQTVIAVSGTTVTLGGNANIAIAAATLETYTTPSAVGNASSQYQMTSTGVISGTGSLTKTGSGVLFLQGVNTFTAPAYPTGGIFLNGGLVSIQQDGASSNLGAAANVVRFNGGGLQVGGQTSQTTITTGTATTSFSALNTFVSSRQFLLESGSGTFDVLNGATLVLNGPITGNAGVGLIKSNSGTLVLNGVQSLGWRYHDQRRHPETRRSGHPSALPGGPARQSQPDGQRRAAPPRASLT